jgi:hypothetical protein
MSNLSLPKRIADDLLWGVDGENGIAAELGIKPAQAYRLISEGKLPVKRIGHRTIVASRRELRRYLAGEITNEAS